MLAVHLTIITEMVMVMVAVMMMMMMMMLSPIVICVLHNMVISVLYCTCCVQGQSEPLQRPSLFNRIVGIYL